MESLFVNFFAFFPKLVLPSLCHGTFFFWFRDPPSCFWIFLVSFSFSKGFLSSISWRLFFLLHPLSQVFLWWIPESPLAKPRTLSFFLVQICRWPLFLASFFFFCLYLGCSPSFLSVVAPPPFLHCRDKFFFHDFMVPFELFVYAAGRCFGLPDFFFLSPQTLHPTFPRGVLKTRFPVPLDASDGFFSFSPLAQTVFSLPFFSLLFQSSGFFIRAFSCGF